MSEPALELREVSRVFARRHALRRHHEDVPAVSCVSLTVSAGEIVALVGESGAGKSTIGRMVLGLEEPDEGEVLFQGVEVGRLRGRARRSIRRRMHLILQDPYESLHPGMRAREAVAEPLRIAGVPAGERERRVAGALEEVALTPVSAFLERFPHELSGGQRQRVAMARAFVARPALIVADEPTSMLDATLRVEILELIAGMRERLGAAFLFITHDLAVARRVSDRIAVMHRGRIVEVDESERLIAAPREDYTKTLLAASEGEL
jgi:ABC-type glutathione transport system ATPase component